MKNLRNKIPDIKIIIDQYKEKYDPDGKMKKELITLFNNKNKKSRSRLLFCSSLNDYDARYYVLNKIYDIDIKRKNEDNEDIKVEYVDELFSLNKKEIELKCSENKKKILKEFDFLPRMAFKLLILNEQEENNFKQKEKQKIKEKINEFLSFNKIEKISFFNAYFTEKEYEENNLIIKKEDFRDIIVQLPIKYFKIKKIFEKEYKIKSIFPLVDYVIEEIFIESISNLILGINQLPIGLRAYVFEYSTILSIEKKYENIIIKKVKNIYKLNTEDESMLDLDTQFIYSIRQTNFRGNYYDYALYFGPEKKLIFFQMTLHKFWKDIIPREELQKNCEEIIKNTNKRKNILSANDIYFYYVIPDIKKKKDLEYNKKMNNFISDLAKYQFQYLEFNLIKNDFARYIINIGEHSKSKMFYTLNNNLIEISTFKKINEINFIFRVFNNKEKEKSFEINDIKLQCNKFFLNKKINRDDKEEQVLKFFNDQKKLYAKFLEYCFLKDEEKLFLINDKANYYDIFLEWPFFLIMKKNNKFYIIHKKNNKGKSEIYSLDEEKFVHMDFNDIINFEKYFLFQVVQKKDFNNFKPKKK